MDSTPNRMHMSNEFLKSAGPRNPYALISMAVGDSIVAERRPWCPPYQTRKTVYVQNTTYIKVM